MVINYFTRSDIVKSNQLYCSGVQLGTEGYNFLAFTSASDMFIKEDSLHCPGTNTLRTDPKS